MPRKAVVLAAGFGTRLLPLSLETPKPLMPCWGRPILEHVLTLLARWGVQEALLNLHHRPEALLRFAQQRRGPPRLTLSFEPEILGTGGALRRAAWFLDTAPCWLLNADVLADLDPRPLIRALAAPRCLAALWLEPRRGPRTVTMCRGLVTGFRSRRPGAPGTYTLAGLHLLRPAVLDYLPAAGPASIIQAYERALAAGRRLAGICQPGSFWADTGTPEGYVQAHRRALDAYRRRQPGGRLVAAGLLRRMADLRRRGVQISGFAAVSPRAAVARGARLSQVVIWDGAEIGGQAVVEDAVVGAGARVRGRARRLAARAAVSLQPPWSPADPQLAAALARLRWRPGDVTVIPLEPRGSARTFTRLQSGRRSVMLVCYGLERAENGWYAAQARWLRARGWPVPAVLADLPAQQALVMEDLGDLSLQSLAARLPPARLEACYRRVLAAVLDLHMRGWPAARRGGLPLAPPFSAALYRWERGFFARQFLQPRLGATPPEIRASQRELSGVAARLLAQPPVLLHRDLQSSNIICSGGRPHFIDFQGLRGGPAAYDLASLLCDPYVALPAAMQRRLLAGYNHAAGFARAVPETVFWLAAVERLAQALGAFGRLAARTETAGFRRHIPAALRMLRRALRRTGACPRLQRLVEKALDTPTTARDAEPRMA